MTHVKMFDPVGITVADLDAATAFLVGLRHVSSVRMATCAGPRGIVVSLFEQRAEGGVSGG